ALALALAAEAARPNRHTLPTRRSSDLLKALQKVRTEIAVNLHGEVNSTLSNINLLSEMARIKADKDIERSKEFIDQISRKSHYMITAMRSEERRVGKGCR